MENVSKESILKAVKPLREMLKDTTNKFGTKTALQERSGDNFVKYSYNKLDKYVTNLAKMLIKLGVKKGDKISVISKNRPEWTISYLAIHMSGAIVVPLDPLLKEGELFNIIKKANVKIVFCSGDYMFLMNGIKGKLDTLERIISMDEDHDEVDIHTMISEGKKLDINPFDVPVTNNDLMVLLFTSGTTGKSKGVMLTNENVIYDVLATVDRVVFDENDTFISILPLHHVFEATVGFIGALVQGSTIMYARGYRPSEIIEEAINKQPFGVKAILKSAYGFVGVMRSFSNANLGKPIFKGLREKSGLSSIRLMVSGGATLKDWVSQRIGFHIHSND
jgi:long-chain acyl-CoA synthetase